ncbi:MAG: purine-nucleoside phosphorylase [Deltaproteobacteria bacterium]|nr:purine-nucleoside phosphorylase [Deltaproteobacteria bacterium]
MISLKAKALAAAGHIRSQLLRVPEIAILTGTGLDGCAAGLSTRTCFEYRDIPHFPVSTVEGHPGQLLTGDLKGKEVAVFKGRFHLYEGYSPQEVGFSVRVMQELGIKKFIVSNAAGGLNPRFSPGDIMIIRDHINLTGQNPLVGPHEPDWGNRFPDMARAYDPDLIKLASAIGNQLNMPLHTGVYAGLLGPSLETPAEIRFLQTIGASAVGFSTIMEVITAVQAGMKVIGLSTLTNVHDPDNPVPATLEEILDVAQRTSPVLQQLIESLVMAM